MRADCHIHMVLDGIDWKASIARGVKDAYIRDVLAAYREEGYTYLRDGGDRWGVSLRAKELAPEYGITYKTPLAPLCLQGHYGAFIGLCYGDTREFSRLVTGQRAAGGDFVKIMISGLMDFDRYGVLTEEGLPPALIKELIHIAHSEGMAVMAHCNGAATALAAAQAGVDSIEHGAYLDLAALETMAENGVVWVPTLSTVGNLLGKGRFCQTAVEAILHSALCNVATFRDLGGLIAPGTDAGAWAVGHTCHTEEAWLAQAGVTEADMQKGVAAIQMKF